MSESELTRLFKYFNDKFDSIESKLDTFATKDDFNRTILQLDAVLKRLDTVELELKTVGYQTTRLETWVSDIANKLNHKHAF